jgi:hypothetical protein
MKKTTCIGTLRALNKAQNLFDRHRGLTSKELFCQLMILHMFKLV